MSCRTYAGGLPSVNEIAAKLRAASSSTHISNRENAELLGRICE